MQEVHRSRSQKRLSKDIARASERRERLIDKGKLSLPSGQGVLAIIVSRSPDDRSSLTPQAQHRAFLREAERLKHERAKSHQAVVVRPIAVTSDLKMDFADPEITDVILIGHGSLGCLWADGGQYFDWRTAAKAAATLKQGRIEQRMCGNLPSKNSKDGDTRTEELPHKYSVALGTFAVSNLANVLAAVGTEVPEVNPPDELFHPVYTGQNPPYIAIDALNRMYGSRPTVQAT